MSKNNHIDYLELAVTNIEESEAFYTAAFGWEFTRYGDEYTAFENTEQSGIAGGLHTQSPVTVGSILPVLFHDDLASAQERIESAGGTIVKELFSFPGGERFHFSDPSGNVLALWRTT